MHIWPRYFSMDTNGLNRCAEAIFAAEMEGGRWVVDVMGAHTLNGNNNEQRSEHSFSLSVSMIFIVL